MGGEAQESQEALIGLMLTFIIAFMGMYFLLILLFDSWTQPLLVLIAVPFGIVGVILTFLLHSEPFSFLAMIGSIGLAGVVANDSLVLVSHLNDMKAKNPDADTRQLVAEGTSDRLRAIVLTTLSTVVGLVPLAYGLGGMDVYMAPMAMALGYGLLFATPTTLLLVPALYVIGLDIKGFVSKLPFLTGRVTADMAS